MDVTKQYGLSGATLVTPKQVLPNRGLTICGSHIARLKEPPAAYVVDLRDHLVFPGLINAHDHLNGTWWPRIGPHRPYQNVYQWLDDLHTSSVRYDRQRNSIDDIYELGMYRNLIAGVTTVADHFWRIDRPGFFTRFPINVLSEYGRTWTPREQVAWGDDIPTEYGLAVRTNQPYIIHLAEGVDQETSAEMDVLLENNALGRNTLIVHGIALRQDDMRAMARVGASVCWCPASNMYLYEQTANIALLQQAGVNIALGTDSSLSGSLNLLDELRTARDVLCTDLGAQMSAQWFVESVTTRAAYALMREGRCGCIMPGHDADLLVLQDRGSDPYTTLLDAEASDVALLCRAGVPIYGDPIYQPLFEQFTAQFTAALVPAGSDSGEQPIFREKLIAGDPLSLLDRLSCAVGRTLEFPFLSLSAPST